MFYSKEIGNYTLIEEIFQSQKTIIYSAQSKSNLKRVILKLYNEEELNYNEISRFEYEFSILNSLQIEGVIKPIRIEYIDHRPFLVLEEFNIGGTSLKKIIKNFRYDLKFSLKIAIEICRVISEIHKQNIIHRDIKPDNILVDKEFLKIKIIDFDLATRIQTEKKTTSLVKSIEGTIQYISPEQTGRVNRYIDYRTDFYSLGITLYELFTGKLPFTSSDPMKLIHQHIAKQPIPPININSNIPITISNIILKLISKVPENRYSSALGIISDLEKVYSNLEKVKFKLNLFQDFSIATRDFADKFILRSKLYERENQIEVLENFFLEATKGEPQVLFVAGYPGIGKTSFVNELNKKVAQYSGFFIKGKYEDFNKATPYKAFIEAFKQLISEILTEDDSKILKWKEKLETNLKDNISVITSILPELELIVGKKEPPVEVDSLSTQIRFNLSLLCFVRVFADKSHPLVLFLDDLQWLDSSSLTLIKYLILSKDQNYFFLIGSYRSNEVDYFNKSSIHPLKTLLDEIKESETHFQTILLSPLSKKTIEKIILDTISSNEDVSELGEIIFQKTGGNPFFINEILKIFFDKRYIYYDYSKESKLDEFKTGRWKWDIEKIKSESITNNVIELMLLKLKNLNKETLDILKLASCLKIEFDLHTLSIINEKSYIQTSKAIWQAITEGIIIPKGNVHMMIHELDLTKSPDSIISYILKSSDQFLHDEVRDAAYLLFKEEEKKKTHLKIGRLLLQEYSEAQINSELFEITSHLNRGKEFITEENEKISLLNLNYKAAERAFQSLAYPTAIDYLKNSISLFKGNPWEENFELAYKIYFKISEAQYSIGNGNQAKNYAKEILLNVKDTILSVSVYALLIKIYNQLIDFDSAFKAGIDSLRILNIKLPEEDFDKALRIEFQKADNYLEERKISDLLFEDDMFEEDKLVAMDVLSSITSTAYLTNSNLYPIIVLKSVTHSLKYGNAIHSCFGFATYGLILGAIQNRYSEGFEFGLLAIRLSDKYNSKTQKCRSAYIFANFNNSWKKHIKVSISINEEAINIGKEIGDMQFTGFSYSGKLLNLLYESENLDHIFQDSISIYKFNEDTSNFWARDIASAVQLVTNNLLGKTISHKEFNSEQLNESKFMEETEKNKTFSAQAVFLIYKMITLYLHNEYEDAYYLLNPIRDLLPYLLGQIEVSEFYFYEALILSKLFSNQTKDDQERFSDIIMITLIKFKDWMENCPENFTCRYKLIQAITKMSRGGGIDSLYTFDEAIQNSRINGFKHIEAIATEEAGRFLLLLDKPKLAKVYLKDSKYSYTLWGCVRKVEELNKEFSVLLKNPNSNLSNITEYSNSIKKDSFDINTALKVSFAIASEIRLDTLLDKTIRVLVENAGAEKGILILKHEKANKFFIQADYNTKTEEIFVLQSLPYTDGDLPFNIIQYVMKTKDNLVIADAYKDQHFYKDSYILHNKVKSILCTPFLFHGELLGILYIENNLFANAFTVDRLELLHIIASQVVVSINNAFIYANLEREVDKRTLQVQETLTDLKKIKENQDGDYYLTSLLIKPLSQNSIENTNIEVQTLISQKKKFQFKNHKEEIGGDIVISSTVVLKNRKMTFFILADAMGKSMQGAGGALVLGSVLKATLERTKINDNLKNLFPEQWLKSAFIELHRVFLSFEGLMLVAGNMAIIDNQTGFMYHLNFENPISILYRNNKAQFIPLKQILRKLGSYGTENNEIIIQTLQLKNLDKIISGSDGRDDFEIGKDADGGMILNDDNNLFLQLVENSDSNLENLHQLIIKKGNLIDDIALHKLTYHENENEIKNEKISLKEILPDYFDFTKKEDRLNLLKEVYLSKKFLNQNYYSLKLLGIRFLAHKELDLAISCFESFFSHNPVDEKVIYLIGLLHSKKNNLNIAIDYFEILRLRNPYNLRVLTKLAEIYLEQKNLKETTRYLNKIFEIHKEYPRAIQLEKKLNNKNN